MQEWALAVTLPNAERRVAEKLNDLGIAFHWFRRRMSVAHRGKLCERMVSAFPRYIFIPLMYCWDILNQVKDIAGIIMFGEKPARIAENELQKLRSQCIDDVLLSEPESPRFSSGDKVMLMRLEATNRDAVFYRSLGQGRCIVLLDCMGSSIFVNVNDSDLKKVNPVPRSRRRRRRRNGGPRNVHMQALESSCSPQ